MEASIMIMAAPVQPVPTSEPPVAVSRSDSADTGAAACRDGADDGEFSRILAELLQGTPAAVPDCGQPVAPAAELPSPEGMPIPESAPEGAASAAMPELPVPELPPVQPATDVPPTVSAPVVESSPENGEGVSGAAVPTAVEQKQQRMTVETGAPVSQKNDQLHAEESAMEQRSADRNAEQASAPDGEERPQAAIQSRLPHAEPQSAEPQLPESETKNGAGQTAVAGGSELPEHQEAMRQSGALHTVAGHAEASEPGTAELLSVRTDAAEHTVPSPAAVQPSAVNQPEAAPREPMELLRLARDIQTQVSQGNSNMRLKLYPEHLGEVSVQVRMDADTAQLILRAESVQSKELLEANLGQLRDSLIQQGIKVDSLQVEVQAENGNGQAGSSGYFGNVPQRRARSGWEQPDAARSFARSAEGPQPVVRRYGSGVDVLA